jgi:hypothetical protein
MVTNQASIKPLATPGCFSIHGDVQEHGSIRGKCPVRQAAGAGARTAARHAVLQPTWEQHSSCHSLCVRTVEDQRRRHEAVAETGYLFP